MVIDSCRIFFGQNGLILEQESREKICHHRAKNTKKITAKIHLPQGV